MIEDWNAYFRTERDKELVPLTIVKDSRKSVSIYYQIVSEWTLTRLTANFVANGYSQTYGVNYVDVFAKSKNGFSLVVHLLLHITGLSMIEY